MGVRETIEKLYRDYASGELDKVLERLPDEFCFEWPFDSRTARYSGVYRTKADLVSGLTDLQQNFDFHEYAATDILVDGDRAAAQLRLELTSRKTGDRFKARIAHFWTFKDGVPVHLVEYMDTALMAAQSPRRAGRIA